jgi:hypothetical protein
MTPEQFCFWLRGYLHSKAEDDAMAAEIQAELAKVAASAPLPPTWIWNSPAQPWQYRPDPWNPNPWAPSITWCSDNLSGALP